MDYDQSKVKISRIDNRLFSQDNAINEGIIDGKYETFYNQDNLLTNAHIIIEKISYEKLVLDIENG